LIIVLVGTHLYMTIRTKFIQRKIGTAIKLSVTADDDAEGNISQWTSSEVITAPKQQ
jgi:AGCS family alanine or glycine:cation symporter